MKKKLLISSLLLIADMGCHQRTPAPFKTTIAGYVIQFPKLSKQLTDAGYSKVNIYNNWYEDSTSTVKVVWLFDPYEFADDRALHLPDKRQAYGVNVYLKGKGDQLDSVKAALEKQYNRSLLPMPITITDDEPQFRQPAGYYCQLGEDAYLFLRKTTCPKGDPWCAFNSLRIAIGYNLDETERQRFASSYGQTWPDRD